MREYTKHIKRLLHDYMAEAYERELQRELTKLDQSFAEWREGRIGSGELSYRVHQYDTGPSHELFKQYNGAPHDMSVAYAIVVGLLKRDEVPAELLEAIEVPLSFYQSMEDRHELRKPEE